MEDYFSPQLSGDELKNVSSIALAHVGDAVYELLIRAWLCHNGKATGRELHRAAVGLVNAHAQATAADQLLPVLTEEERSVFRRGRNAHVNTIPHSASRADYLKATALECLFGYLFLSGRKERVNQLFAAIVEEGELCPLTRS